MRAAATCAIPLDQRKQFRGNLLTTLLHAADDARDVTHGLGPSLRGKRPAQWHCEIGGRAAARHRDIKWQGRESAKRTGIWQFLQSPLQQCHHEGIGLR